MSERILIYATVDPADRGGVQRVCERLASYLRTRGHIVMMAWPQPNPHCADDATFHLPPLLWRGNVPGPRSLWAACRAGLRLAYALIRFRPRIVNVHFATAASVYFLLLRPVFRYKLVLSVHGSDVLRPQPCDVSSLARVIPRVDAITTVSSVTAARINAWPGIDRERVHVIRNGVDVAFWAGARLDDAPEADPPVVLSVGRLDPVKGHDVLLRAFALVRARVPSARLVILGGGGFRQRLEELAVELALQHHVEFAGALGPHEVRSHMGTAQVFVLPSRSEGLPLALLEAMAAGLPVVATRVGGVPEVIAPGTGVLVAPDEPEALAEAVTSLLQDAQCRARLRDSAARRVTAFSAQAAEAAYEGVLTITEPESRTIAENLVR